MIRSLRKRFICSAMAAFGILVLILLAGVTAVSYLQLEDRTDNFIEFVLGESEPPHKNTSRQQNPGRHMRPMDNPIAYYDLQINTSGEIIEVREKGIWEPDTDMAKDVAAQILESGKLKGNREYLLQMMHMLLDNAVQYTNEGGEIRISMEQKRRRVRLLFENTVECLPDCPPESLFDRFYRGDSARTQSSGGCGIGLSAALAIAEMHRGKISAEYSNENRICFAVELPL